jgi:hypothetical protein
MSRQTLLSRAEPVDAPMPDFSDDECVQKLAMLIKHKDNKSLGEVVALIGRLAVPIE